MEISTKKDYTHIVKEGEMVICPKCGQKLTEVLSTTGHTYLRIMCRRCKERILVDIKE